ncbi:hypothetical protein DAIF1_40800 [Stenotrophomonas indicatrix]|nr:hypothetical protein DAIF1_40800 [Stenotrophomonas indicatrix]
MWPGSDPFPRERALTPSRRSARPIHAWRGSTGHCGGPIHAWRGSTGHCGGPIHAWRGSTGIAVAPSTHGVDLLALRWPYPRMAWIYWHCGGPIHAWRGSTGHCGGPIHAWRGPLTVNWSRSTPCVDALRAADKKQRRRASCGRRRVPSPGTLPYQRMTSTGSVLRASTSAVWLPSSTRVTPRRPCEVITIRSLLRWPAVSMMPSAA